MSLNLVLAEGLDVTLLFSRRRIRLRQFPSACKARILYVILLAIDAYVALGWKDFNLLVDQTHAEDMVYLRWVCTDSEAPIYSD